jgi:hypothetical protein
VRRREFVGLALGALAVGEDVSPETVIRPAPLIQMPGVKVPSRGLDHECDSNSPLHWDGDTLYVFNSYSHPWQSSGNSLADLGNSLSTKLGAINDKLEIWLEATWRDDSGLLYGAYHYEPDLVCFSNKHLPTMPRIGWLRSADNGATWEDLGFVIEAKPCARRCDTASPWDAGGTGDFTFLPDARGEYFYFYLTSYDSRPEQQGVLAARMRCADRDNPSGKVFKWYDGAWREPGLWGSGMPVFASETDYHGADGRMFWGPAVHWNRHLESYVMLLNHAIDTRLNGDGIYISFNRRIEDPAAWSRPRRILTPEQVRTAMAGSSVSQSKLNNGWYPQVIGTAKGETDKLSGRVARLFMAGVSRLEIVFLRPGEKVE